MEPIEVTHESQSSITLTRSSTNQKYGWQIKRYLGSPLPDVDELAETDKRLRRLFLPPDDLSPELEASLAAKRATQERAS